MMSSRNSSSTVDATILPGANASPPSNDSLVGIDADERRLALVSEASGISQPLAGGESEDSPDGLVALAETGAVDFLQGDVRHHHGFTGCQRAVDFCRGRDIEFVPHNFGTWLGLLANAHLVAAAPEVHLVEYPIFEDDPLVEASGEPGMYPFDLAFDIVAGRPPVENGRLEVPTEPGLGIDMNLDVIEEYPFIEGPWTEFQYET